MAYDIASGKSDPGKSARIDAFALHAERLEVQTSITSATARFRKTVISEVKTFEVPLVREELTIERRSISGAQRARSPIGEGYAFHVALSVERCSVRRNTVVAEQVRIGARQVVETERVSESLRHEELQIEEIPASSLRAQQ